MLSAEFNILRQQIQDRIDATGQPELPSSLDGHRVDIGKELAHALDIEKWIRQLDPNPSVELLLAGRWHDWERTVYPGSTGGFFGDRKTQEYLEYKKAHAARSAALSMDALVAAGLPIEMVGRVGLLILHHDDTGDEVRAIGDPELQTLVSADSLSFFTQIIPDMLSRNVSQDQIRAKMIFMIGKMDQYARKILAEWHSPYDSIETWKAEVLNQVENK